MKNMLKYRQKKGITFMLYGYTQNSRTLVIAAADTYEEMLEFSNTLGQFPGSRQTSFVDHLKSEFKDYRKPVFIIPFGSDKQLHQWCEGQVELVNAKRCVEIHQAMIEDLVDNEEDDRKPLEDVFALKDEDPWDLRSEEQKAAEAQAAAANKKISDQVSKNISGSSFGGNKSRDVEETLRIEDIQKINESAIAVSATKQSKRSNEKIETIEDLLTLASEYEVAMDAANPLQGLDAATKIEELDEALQKSAIDVFREVKIKIVAKKIVEEFRGENFIYAWNDLLSENPAVGGNYPVFEAQSVAEGVSVSELNEILPAIDKRIETISGGIFVFKGDRNVCDAILQKHGLKQVKEIVHKWAKRDAIPDDMEITPKDFARALAGDGTSTMAITGSWGKEKVSKTVDEYDLENAFEIDLTTLALTSITKDQLAAPHKVSLENIDIELDLWSATVSVPQNNILLKSNKRITVISTEDLQHHRKVNGGHIIVGHKNGSSIFVNHDKKLVEIKVKYD